MKQPKTLSASSIKSLENCSWLYYNTYENKVPQKQNEGAARGTIVHSILELLLKPKHKKHFDLICSSGNIDGSEVIRRLVIKLLNKENILNPDNYNLCSDMILVALKTDFFGENGVLGKPEFYFELENTEPVYKIRGYIDKLIFYDNNTSLKIVDYKTSKNKFSEDELNANVQAMVYSLVGYKMFNVKKVSAEFIFLRYSNKPIQQVAVTEIQLRGFEAYLAYLYEVVNNFDESIAYSNMAADSPKNRWLCKAGKWECPYLKAFEYYVILDEDGSIARSSLKKEDLIPGERQRIEKRFYEGCPKWKGADDEL